MPMPNQCVPSNCRAGQSDCSGRLGSDSCNCAMRIGRNPDDEVVFKNAP